MVTPLALRLDDDDTSTDDVVAFYLSLAVLQYNLRSKPGTFTGTEFSIQISLIAIWQLRSVDDCIGGDVF